MKISVWILSIYCFIGLFSWFIANDKPLVCKYKNNWLFPIFSTKNTITLSNGETLNYNMRNDWKLLDANFSIFPLCAYSPQTIDASNAPLKSPFDNQVLPSKTEPIPFKFRHWLGTTQNGNDVLSCIIHGASISLAVGILSTLLGFLIGVTLGAIAGYFGDKTLKIGLIQSLLLPIGIIASWFYGIVTQNLSISNALNQGDLSIILQISKSATIIILTMAITFFIGKKIEKSIGINVKINFPIDGIISKSIEILNSIPNLLMILTISSIAKPSFTLLILIIGTLSWTNIARVTRIEYMKAVSLNYVVACRAIGMSHINIIVKQILPNTLPIIIVQFIFGIVGAILVESSLSFLGVGVPIDTTTWGSILREAKNNFSAWWLVVFPGFCILLLMYSCNKIATGISKK